MLRGNHEERRAQMETTFYRLCMNSFENDGIKIWEAINKAFDRLPLAAIIDNSIFCAHGGIPASVLTVADLEASIPTPLKNINDSAVATEILWNDPMTVDEVVDREQRPSDFLRLGGQQYPSDASGVRHDQVRYTRRRERRVSSDAVQMAPQLVDSLGQTGFYDNVKRLTAYVYGPAAVDAFLSANGLQYVLRAHECAPPGFRVDGKVITVFSTPEYGGNKNMRAGAALVDGARIRLMSFDGSDLRGS